MWGMINEQRLFRSHWDLGLTFFGITPSNYYSKLGVAPVKAQRASTTILATQAFCLQTSFNQQFVANQQSQQRFLRLRTSIYTRDMFPDVLALPIEKCICAETSPGANWRELSKVCNVGTSRNLPFNYL